MAYGSITEWGEPANRNKKSRPGAERRTDHIYHVLDQIDDDLHHIDHDLDQIDHDLDHLDH